MEKFNLINKARLRIKVVEPFEVTSMHSSMINAILISYGYVFKPTSMPVMQVPMLNPSKTRETNIKNFYKKGWVKTCGFKIFF